jgi:LCP family protein required for cell wall assembly
MLEKFKNFMKDKSFLRRASLILVVVLVVTYVLALYSAFTTNLIPGKFIGVLYLLSFLATAAIVYFLATNRISKKVRIVLLVLALIGSILNLYVYSVGMATSSFLKSTQQQTQSYEEYSIVALKANNISLATPNQTTGILSSEPEVAKVQTEATKLTKAAFAKYNDPTSMVLSLQNNDAKMVIFKSSYMRLLQEQNNNELYSSLEVLATFKVAVTSTQGTVQGDVSKPFAVYISGIDTYGDISTTSRSDVNILAVVNPTTHRVLLVNTPRDYYVQLHGTTGVKDKLTHAGLYGIDQSVTTLEDLYDIDIKYNIRINFSSLEKLVNTLGGVEVQSAYNFSAGGFNFVEGTNQLDGKQALTFSRERHSFEGGDRTRGENQMQVIKAIIAKMSSPTTALKFQQILGDMQGTFQTNMSTQDLTTLIRNQIDSLAKWTVTSSSVDGSGAKESTYSMGAQKLYVMIPDQTSVNSAKNAMKSTLGQ